MTKYGICSLKALNVTRVDYISYDRLDLELIWSNLERVLGINKTRMRLNSYQLELCLGEYFHKLSINIGAHTSFSIGIRKKYMHCIASVLPFYLVSLIGLSNYFSWSGDLLQLTKYYLIFFTIALKVNHQKEIQWDGDIKWRWSREAICSVKTLDPTI